MKPCTRILFVFTIFLALVSCSKDNDGGTAGADITGTYKFVSLQAKTSSTVQSTSGSYIDKTITTSEYTTQNNTGTVIIDATKFTTTNFSYSINTTARSTLYENGVLTDTFSLPFQFTVLASSGTGTYKRVSADSLYFSSGSSLIGGTASASQPGGARIKYENGKLTLYSSAAVSSTSTNQGATVLNTGIVTSVITLQKQ
ncbi:MAG: hypothetical protein INR73_26490 [Williamsia sp.]|nr:hypothetical protein [Williamsia sp.]